MTLKTIPLPSSVLTVCPTFTIRLTYINAGTTKGDRSPKPLSGPPHQRQQHQRSKLLRAGSLNGPDDQAIEQANPCVPHIRGLILESLGPSEFFLTYRRPRFIHDPLPVDTKTQLEHSSADLLHPFHTGHPHNIGHRGRPPERRSSTL